MLFVFYSLLIRNKNEQLSPYSELILEKSIDRIKIAFSDPGFMNHKFFELKASLKILSKVFFSLKFENSDSYNKTLHFLSNLSKYSFSIEILGDLNKIIFKILSTANSLRFSSDLCQEFYQIVSKTFNFDCCQNIKLAMEICRLCFNTDMKQEANIFFNFFAEHFIGFLTSFDK